MRTTKPLYPADVLVAVCLDCGALLGVERPSRKGLLRSKHVRCPAGPATKLSGVMGVRYRLDTVYGLVPLKKKAGVR